MRVKEVVEEGAEVDEGVLVVHGIGLGRSRVREGDVVTTVVISLEGGVLGLLGHLVALLKIERLPDRGVLVVDLKRNVLGLSEDDLLGVLTARARSADTEEVLDLRLDDGPDRADMRLVEASIVVAFEGDLLFLVHLLGEPGVDEEDR